MDKFLTGCLFISVQLVCVVGQETELEPSQSEEKYWMRTATCCESFSHSPCVEFTVNVTINNPAYISNVVGGELEKSDKNLMWYLLEGEEGKQQHTGANKHQCVTFHLFYLNHDIHLSGTCLWTFTWETNEKESTCVGINTGSTNAARTPRATNSVYQSSNTDGTRTSHFSATGDITTDSSITKLTTQSKLTTTPNLTTQPPTVSEMTSYPHTSSGSTESSVNSSGVCLCKCGCREPKNITKMENEMDKIIADLVIPKNSTSQKKRKLTSATDPRSSSRGIGAVGVVVIATVLSLVVVVDARFFVWNMLSKCCSFRSNK